MHPCDNTEALLRTLTAPRRNRYFYGKRMDVPHFRMEQDYGKLKQWLLNRLTVGKGVVCGLRVGVDGDRLCVDPGVALDGLGREIVVPVRTCIDPATQGDCCPPPCCGEHGATPDRPAAIPRPVEGVAAAAGVAVERGDYAVPAVEAVRPAPARGVFTLWACYRECRTDYQPVLVSDCDTREQCEAGTIVETFCLKVTPGLPPLQGDPAWCDRLWKKAGVKPPKGATDKTAANLAAIRELSALAEPAAAGARAPTAADQKAALESRRRLLCMLLDGGCDPDEGDPCVPLAAFALRDGRIAAVETCLVRPRVYSNAALFEMILCLAARLDECCDGGEVPQPVVTLRVASVDFLGGPNKAVIASVASPLAPTLVPIGGQGRWIRIKFTGPFAQGAKLPTTPGPGDANWKQRNVVVIPSGGGANFVPGKLIVEAPDTLLWELTPEGPFYDNGYKGWQKGERKLVVFGSADAGAGRSAVESLAGNALDGEPAAPANGAISGDGAAGGDFSLTFRIG